MTKQMKMSESVLNEAKDLDHYKRLIQMFGAYYDKFSGWGQMYRKVMAGGLKIIPKEKKAQSVLSHVIGKGEGSNIQLLLNGQLAELPVQIRPVFKQGNKIMCAYWHRDDKIFTKIVDLLDFTGKAGSWTDEQGKSVTLINTDEK